MEHDVPKKISLNGFGHICINVDNIDKATILYKNLFGANPVKHFLATKDKNWAKNIGFSDAPETIEMSNRFLLFPKINLYVELLEYHKPTSKKIHSHNPNDINGVTHICLTVDDIDEAFEFVKQAEDIQIKCSLKSYTKPLRINVVKEDDFYFFDKQLENNPIYKSRAAYLTNTIRFFTFVDPYGVTWELEESEETYEF